MYFDVKIELSKRYEIRRIGHWAANIINGYFIINALYYNVSSDHARRRRNEKLKYIAKKEKKVYNACDSRCSTRDIESLLNIIIFLFLLSYFSVT